MTLTHLTDQGHPTMVDVGGKSPTHRIASASGTIAMSQEAYEAVVSQQIKKGPVLHTAIIAAIMGAKKTSELIPMCHPLLLDKVQCDVEELSGLPGFKLIVTVGLTGKTGVEMEALTGVSVGLLTIYDMVKAIDKGMEMGSMHLLHKEGGKSGTYSRDG